MIIFSEKSSVFLEVCLRVIGFVNSYVIVWDDVMLIIPASFIIWKFYLVFVVKLRRKLRSRWNKKVFFKGNHYEWSMRSRWWREGVKVTLMSRQSRDEVISPWRQDRPGRGIPPSWWDGRDVVVPSSWRYRSIMVVSPSWRRDGRDVVVLPSWRDGQTSWSCPLGEMVRRRSLALSARWLDVVVSPSLRDGRTSWWSRPLGEMD